MDSIALPRNNSVEDCLTIKLSTLNKQGHLAASKQSYSFQYSWERNNQRVQEVVCRIIQIQENRKELHLRYSFKGETVLYRVNMIAVNTNLGNGHRWYFICPKTNKRCMNLIRPPGQPFFLHREAYPNLLYRKQKQSKRWRETATLLHKLFHEQKLKYEPHS